MNFKKIVASIAAAAMAVSMVAVNAFAATVEIDSTYPGGWSSSGNGIKKADLEAVGGDVKITLNIEVQNKLGLADQLLINPIDYDNGWVSQTDNITSDTEIAKVDGWICVPQDATTVEFVLDAEAISALGDSGLCFSVQEVLVKSADYELAEAKQAEVIRVSDQEGKDYCFGKFDPKGGAAEEAPAADAPAADTTEAPATGNAPVAAIAVVMALAGAAAVASKKRN